MRKILLKDLEPNVYSDMVSGKPKVIEIDNDGTYLYRYNISPYLDVSTDEGENGEKKQIGWKYRELRLNGTPNKSQVKLAIIRSVYDESTELDIRNNYKMVELGIEDDPTAIERYKEYLLFYKDVEKQMIEDFK